MATQDKAPDGPEDWVLALKVSDGAGRAVAPSAIAALSRRGVQVPAEMGTQAVTDLHGKAVGKVAPLTHGTSEEHGDLRSQPRGGEAPENSR